MFELRDYQRAALAELWKYWRGGGGNPLIDLATGLGKSFLIAELGRRFCSQGRRVLVLSHVREIIVQDLKAIRTTWPEAPGRHDARASTVAPLSTAVTWLMVSRCSVEEHLKPGRPPSLRIDFWTGQLGVSDWLAFEHGEGARWHAAKKWRALGGRQPAPVTEAEALARRDEITAVAAIGVQRDGDYWRVVDVKTQAQRVAS